MQRSNLKEALRDQYERKGIYEFPFFCIGRQGVRTAVEILARALNREGKHVYLGQNLARRSMATNNNVGRFSETRASSVSPMVARMMMIRSAVPRC